MRKLLHRSLLALAATLSWPVLAHGQPASKVASGIASEARSTLQPEARSENAPCLLVRTQSSTTTSSVTRSVEGYVTAPPATVLDQMRRATGGVEVYGNVTYSEKPEGSTKAAHVGIWRFTDAGEFTAVKNSNLGGCYAAVVIDGIYHNYYPDPGGGVNVPRYKAYDVKTWAQVTRPVSTIKAGALPYALCTDGNTAYGQYLTGSQFKYGRFDVNTNTWTFIADCPAQWNACAWGNDGFIYAIDMAGDAYKVNPATGTMSKLGATGAVPKYVTGATIDRKTGRMFWTVSPEDESGNLYEVNLTTGAATKLCEFQYKDEIAGLFVPYDTDSLAPGAVTGMQLLFPDGNLQGKVSFTCPTTLYDGSSATGALTYTVLVNGVKAASGACSFGQQMSVDVSVSAAGKTYFSVLVSNDRGEGPKAHADMYVGKDTPKPTTVKASLADGKVNVSWTPVTATVNGGYMDPAKVRYTVTRMPGALVMADTVATAIDDVIPEPAAYTVYYYTVVADCEGLKSTAAQSNKVGMGSYPAPYLQAFETKAVLDEFVIIDANADKITWDFYNSTAEKCVRARYSGYKAMDDWLVSPAIRMEAGSFYKISLDAHNSNYKYPERFEVKVGNAPTAEALTTTVIEPTVVPDKTVVNYSAYFQAPADGKYYIGVHGISDKNMNYLFVDNLAVSEPISGNAPATVDSLRIVPDQHGALKATLSCKLPSKTMAGSPLGAITSVIITRNGTPVATLINRAPGSELTWTDEAVPAKGQSTWSVLCSNDSGDGIPAEAFAIVGLDKPSMVSNIRLAEETPGTVTISWDAPTTDIYGKLLGDTQLTYTVTKASDTKTVYGQGLTTTSLTYKFVEPNAGQSFVQVAVFATSPDGTSTGLGSPLEPVGTPYAVPYKESFPAKRMDHALATRAVENSGATWTLQADGDLGILSADRDNGFLAGKFTKINGKSLLCTGNIDLATLAKPVFTFYTYNMAKTETDGSLTRNSNELEVLVCEAHSDNWQVLRSGTVDELCSGDTMTWRRVSADLSAYRGKKVQLALQATCKKFTYMMVDRMEVADELGHNLAVATLDAPAVARANEPFTLDAVVENRGSEASTDYSVDFYRHDEAEPFASVTGPALVPGGDAVISTPVSLGFENAEVRFHAVVRAADDQKAADNTSATVAVERVYSAKPAPGELFGHTSDGKASLSWSAPDLGEQNLNGEDCEQLESWAYTAIGDWTMVDADGGQIGGFRDFTLPNNKILSKRSFFVLEKTAELDSTFAVHSGTKCLASMFLYNDGKVDDRAISPMLDGSAQTVTFWARSYAAGLPERMEILYSATGRDWADFTLAQTVAKVPGTWTQYTLDVPAGTKFFAIRSNAAAAGMLMLDDFAYHAAPRQVCGYVIYRDGKRLTTLNSLSYEDNDAPKGMHSYRVTALYSDGDESAPTNSVSARTSLSSQPSAISYVEGGRGYLLITGAEGQSVTVTASDGLVCHSGTATPTLRLPLPAGVYVVRIGGAAVKAVVR